MDRLKPALNRLALAVGERIPSGLRKPLLSLGPSFDLRGERRRAQDPFRFDPPEWRGSGRCPYVLGIFKEFWHAHWHYIAACRDLDVSYRVLDISGPDWLDVIRNSGCDAFLARPSVQCSAWKQMYDERLRILASSGEHIVFPDVDSLWLWESKRKMHYWLAANRVPHPPTRVFYDEQKALQCAASCTLPIVYKSDMGSGASGVIVFRRRHALKKHILRCFRKGFTTYRRRTTDLEWGCILLQEYLPLALEWRVLKIGNSYSGHQKLRLGDFHSGSNKVGWEPPPCELLDFVRRIAELGDFQSMDFDIFETADGRYLVNEMQAYFGSYRPYQMRVDNKPGRYLWDRVTNSWSFDEGEFYGNASCNLRVETLVKRLETCKRKELSQVRSARDRRS